MDKYIVSAVFQAIADKDSKKRVTTQLRTCIIESNSEESAIDEILKIHKNDPRSEGTEVLLTQVINLSDYLADID